MTHNTRTLFNEPCRLRGKAEDYKAGGWKEGKGRRWGWGIEHGHPGVSIEIFARFYQFNVIGSMCQICQLSLSLKMWKKIWCFN